ncbi:hypothetical protein ColKHC_09933 [Colletotrichum higginsianum]|nr:hypothetical protein ColKHC_09933 [Colletotrichum higginsianum]
MCIAVGLRIDARTIQRGFHVLDGFDARYVDKIRVGYEASTVRNGVSEVIFDGQDTADGGVAPVSTTSNTK